MYRFRRWIQNLKIISKDPFVILKVICCLLIFNDFLMSFWKIQKKFLGCNFFFFSLYPLGSGSIWTFLGSWDPDTHNNRCGSPTLAKRLFHKTQNLLNRYTVIKLQHLNNGRQGTEDMRRETWEVRHETWDRRYEPCGIGGTESRDFQHFFTKKPPGPQMNRQKRFCEFICEIFQK